MKKIISLFVLLSLLFALTVCLTSCGDSLSTRTLNVYNWGQYISDGSEDTYDTNAEFEIYWNETSKEIYGISLAEKYGYNINVNYTTYASNEDMYNKIVSGSAKYDVIIPSEYMIARMAEEGLLYELNPEENVPYYEYIDDEFKNLFFDPENKYSVPYAYGIVGIIYNTDHVDTESEGFGTWNLMWNEEYKGKILQFNNPRDAFATALYRRHYDVNGTDKAKWQTALDDLAEQKPLVQSYVMDEIFNKMTTSSAWISAYYVGDFLTMYDGNDSLDFYYPEDGTNIYIDSMCIPYNSQNPEAATEYINFMLMEEPGVANAEYTCYATPNRLVYENEEYIEYLNDCYDGDSFDSGYELIYPSAVEQIDENTDYSDTDTVHVSYYHAITNDEATGNMLNFTNDLWESLKIEDSGATWVYVTAAVIVFALIALGSVKFIIKKKRESRY